ncbi:MAG: hypothetical protein FJ290_08510 [Planctomycetes bacterium]|nr:hypothetical protein [Planctomycetota bacterium]
MSIYAQHGYGKSDKIQRAMEARLISGVILSPRDESPENLTQFSQALRLQFPSADLALDPQFYATTIAPVRDGHLPEYAYYHPGLTRRDFISPASIARFVAETLDYERRLEPSFLVAPTVHFEDFRDPWSQISLSLAQEAAEYHSRLQGAPPLYLSLAFAERALGALDSLGDFLDILSGFEVRGFYVTVSRDTSQYQPHMEAARLENLLYLTYTLSVVNEYQVVLAYSDLIGILLQAVGAHATACGWHHSLRQFSLARFRPSTGGRQPRPRYTSIPLLASILVIPELQAAFDAGLGPAVLSRTDYDGALGTASGMNAWRSDRAQRALHHWAVINRTVNDITSRADIGDRLTNVLLRIGQASALFSDLQNRGVVFDPTSGPGHLDQWQQAIESFRRTASV